MRKAATWLAVSLAAFAVLGAGCGDNRSEAELVADATRQLAAQKYRGAVIDLRNALRANPNNKDARLALARALVELDDGAAAEKEIMRAIDLGAVPDDYYRTLARALLMRNGFAELISELDADKVTDPALASEVTAMRARAMLGLGSRTEADRAFKEVLSAGESVEAQRIALLGKASLAYDDADLATSESFIRRSLEIAPDSAESYLRLGQILLAQEKYDAAKTLLAPAAVSGVRMSRSQEFRLRGDRALAFIGLGELDAAAEAAEAMATIAPEHPMSAFLRGRIELQRGDLDRALEYLQVLDSKYPDFAPGQALLGAVSMRRGELEQAESYLGNALELDRSNVMARQLLAELRLRTRRPADAAATLREGLTDDNADPQLLAMLGRATVQAGEEDAGIEYLRRSLEKDPDNADARLSLAAALLAQGNRDEAITLIESIPDAVLPAQRKRLMLIVAGFDRENPEPAKEELRSFLSQAGDDVSLRSLAGSFYVSTGDLDDARAQFEEVLRIEPGNFGAKLSILRLDQAAGDFSRSRALFTAARDKDPRDVVAIVLLARIAEFEGQEKRSLELAKEAYALDETALYPGVRLAADALARKDIVNAERYAQAAVANNPDAPGAQGVMGSVHLVRGQLAEAIQSLRRAAQLAPDTHFYQYQLAQAQLQSGQLAQARESFARAYKLDKTHVNSLRALALLELRAKNSPGADRLLDEAAATFGDGPILDELTGDVRIGQNRPVDALARYQAAQAAAPSWTLAAKIYTAREQMQSSDAESTLVDWLKDNPGHVPARLMLAQAYQRKGVADQAMAQYEALLERTPDSALALNNLAWLYYETGDRQKRERALEMAARAYEVLPDNVDIADTYGWIQFKSGYIDEGVQTLRMALAKTSPRRNPEIAYHLAAALHEGGASNEARETLLQALSTTRPFPSRENAQQLYDSL